MASSQINFDLYQDEIYNCIFKDDVIINNIILFLWDEKQINVISKII